MGETGAISIAEASGVRDKIERGGGGTSEFEVGPMPIPVYTGATGDKGPLSDKHKNFKSKLGYRWVISFIALVR